MKEAKYVVTPDLEISRHFLHVVRNKLNEKPAPHGTGTRGDMPMKDKNELKVIFFPTITGPHAKSTSIIELENKKEYDIKIAKRGAKLSPLSGDVIVYLK